MEDHFSAFSFVDRIAGIEHGTVIRGSYAIPVDLGTFPSSLVAEAVGQLAAWGAMAKTGFRKRPVAGLAERIDLLAPVRPGQVLEMTAMLESVDEEAASYKGSAQVNGTPVVTLENCVGPMLPLEEFDASDALKKRFDLLCGAGAAAGAFKQLPTVEFQPMGAQPGQWLKASLAVPKSAPFFADHFPRRPVFPGSLLMQAQLQLAASLAAGIPTPTPGGTWQLQTVLDMKLRTFIPPGESLELEAKLSERSNAHAVLSLEARRGKRTVGSARVLCTSSAHS